MYGSETQKNASSCLSKWSEKYRLMSHKKYSDVPTTTLLHEPLHRYLTVPIKGKKKNGIKSRKSKIPPLHRTHPSKALSQDVDETQIRLNQLKNGQSSSISSTRSSVSLKPIVAAVPFYASHLPRNSRCEYCGHPGGELECSTCNVVAHPACYVTHREKNALHKHHLRLEIPEGRRGDTVWICSDCHITMSLDHIENTVIEREGRSKVIKYRSISVVKAYLRMYVMRQRYLHKRSAIILMQSAIRGKITRLRLQTVRCNTIRPLRIQLQNMHINVPHSISKSRGSLSTTFHPIIVVTLVSAERPHKQLFNYETKVPSGALSVLRGGKVQIDLSDVVLFVPGVVGTAWMVFTVCHRSGPKNTFLGQKIVKIDALDLFLGKSIKESLTDNLHIIPRVGNRSSMRISYDYDEFLTDASHITFTIHMYDFLSTMCGYLEVRNDVSDIAGTKRWCVLVENTLYVYRFYGLTAASEILNVREAKKVSLITTGRLHSKDVCMGLEYPSRVRLFQAVGSEQKRWMQRFERVREKGRSVSNAATIRRHSDNINNACVDMVEKLRRLIDENNIDN